MWEVLEYILENNLNVLLRNVREYLGKDGYFIGLILFIEYLDESGIFYYVMFKNKLWWNDKF